MDETLLGLMEILGPIILLVLLVWVMLRNRKRSGPPKDVTEQATRDAYREEEEMRREGTDDR
jgi:hypothetical protein